MLEQSPGDTRRDATRVLEQLPHYHHGPCLRRERVSGPEAAASCRHRHQKPGVDMKLAACKAIHVDVFVLFHPVPRGVMNLRVIDDREDSSILPLRVFILYLHHMTL